MNYYRPKLESVALRVGLAWRGGNYLYQEKSDGQHEFASIAGMVFNAERMRSGELVINDLLAVPGQDMRREPTRVRWAELLGLSHMFAGNIRLCRVGPGGEFLEKLLSDGGEGIVAKPWDAPFGASWLKCKRVETFDLVCAERNVWRGSIRLAGQGGEDFGWCPCRAQFERVRVGDIVEIEAYARHRSGKLREARFKRIRQDKTEVTT